MNETEYTAPNEQRWMVSAVSDEYDMPFVDGAPGTARTITARRWVKSRQAFAKQAQPFTVRNWSQWAPASTPKGPEK